MKRIAALVFVALLAACAPKHGKMSAAPAPSATPGQTINIDPSVAPGMVAAVNTVVFDSGGTYLWTKYAVSNTAWRPVPTSAIVASDPSQPPGLKAAIGFVVTKNDGSASWVKSGAGDTAWSTNPGGGGSGIVDGGVIAPLAGQGGLANPLHIVDGGIQSQSNVAITGGSITGVNTATRTVQGAMSAGDKAYSDDFDGWKKSVYALMIAADPTLTGFKAIDLGANPPGSTSVPSDALLEGQALTSTSANSILIGASVFQNLPAGHWAFAFQGKIPTLTSGQTGQMGVQIAAGTQFVFVGTHFATDAANFIVRMVPVAGSGFIALSPWNSAMHTFAVTDNATTITGWIDGVSRGSTSDRSNLPPAAPMLPDIYANPTGGVLVTRAAYGFVAPS